jgi:hypothetical protein
VIEGISLGLRGRGFPLDALLKPMVAAIRAKPA